MGDHVQENLGDFGGGGKIHVFSKTGLSDQMVPPGMRAFFRPHPNHLTFGTHDLFHKQN